MSTTSSVRVAESADVSGDATIGDGSSIWHLAQVREGRVLGENCVIGRGAYIGTGVRLGDNCKVQNYALVYEPAVLGERRLHRPGRRAHERHLPARGQSRRHAQERPRLGACRRDHRDGASVGARAVCVAPVTHRRVGDGRGRRRGHQGRARPRPGGRAFPPGASAGSDRPVIRSERDGDEWRCPVSSTRYAEADGALREVTTND